MCEYCLCRQESASLSSYFRNDGNTSHWNSRQIPINSGVIDYGELITAAPHWVRLSMRWQSIRSFAIRRQRQQRLHNNGWPSTNLRGVQDAQDVRLEETIQDVDRDNVSYVRPWLNTTGKCRAEQDLHRCHWTVQKLLQESSFPFIMTQDGRLAYSELPAIMHAEGKKYRSSDDEELTSDYELQRLIQWAHPGGFVDTTPSLALSRHLVPFVTSLSYTHSTGRILGEMIRVNSRRLTYSLVHVCKSRFESSSQKPNSVRP